MSKRTRRRNPLAVLFVTLCLMVPVFLSYDHTTPVVFFVIGFLNFFYIGGLNLPKYLKTLAALSIVSLGLFVLNILFPAEGVNGFSRGTAVFLRSVCLISLSIGYIFVVNAYDLFRAFMAHLGLNYRFGFALFAGWNTIPLLARDLRIIEKAQDVRFGLKRRPLNSRLKTAVVLLSGAVRHGERVSLSMAARGIDTAEKRTSIKDSPWPASDTWYCASGALISGLAFLMILQRGLFVFELG